VGEATGTPPSSDRLSPEDQGDDDMKVRDVMTASVVTARPTDSIRDVARRMSEIDTGVIPVTEGDTVVGLITDRDIVLRIVAEDGDIGAPVSQFMTTGVETCQADDSVREAARKMADMQIRRLIVLGKPEVHGHPVAGRRGPRGAGDRRQRARGHLRSRRPPRVRRRFRSAS
jgi:predicted transcriptional regulator